MPWFWIFFAAFSTCLASILIPVFRSAKIAEILSSILRQAKQGATAESMLIGKKDGKIPAFRSASEAKQALDPYMASALNSFDRHGPMQTEADLPIKFPDDYVWNPELFDHYRDGVINPSDIWIFRSTKKYFYRYTVGFLDGHAKSFEDPGLATILAVHPVIDPKLDQPSPPEPDNGTAATTAGAKAGSSDKSAEPPKPKH